MSLSHQGSPIPLCSEYVGPKGLAQQRPLPTLRVQVIGTFSHQKYVMTTRQTNKCKSSYDPALIHQVVAGHREAYDKIATMSTEPKSTQFPVTNILARMRVVGCATNVLSLFIDQLASVEVGKSE